MKFLRIISLAAGVIVAVLMATAPALAYNPFSDACSRGGGSSAACSASGNDPLTGSGGTLGKVVDALMLVAGIMAVIFIIVGGIKYITSNGDSASTASAKNTIIYAAIGLIAVIIARQIINFVISKV